MSKLQLHSTRLIMLLNQLMSATLFLLFALMLSVPHSAELAFTILSLTGLVVMLKDRFSKFTIVDFKIYTLLVWWFLLVIGITIINTENIDMGIYKLGTNIHYLFSPFAIVLLYKLNLKTIIPNAIKLGVIIASVYAVYQYHVLDIGRAHGVSHPVIFGDLVTIMAFIAISNLIRENFLEKIVSIIALIAGMYASYLSATRGAWLLIPLLFVVLMVVWNKQQLINKKTVFISFLVIGVTIFSLTSNDKVVKRVNKAVIEFNVKDSLSSVATRLTMWRHGFEAFKQQPFLGYGLQNTTNVVANHIENESNEYKNSKQAEYHFKRFDHLHNEYINTLVGKGVLGLVTLLVLLLLPLAIFWRRVTVTDLSQAYFATIGIVTIIGYLIIGLTNIISTQPLLNIFFLMILAIAFIGSSTNKTI